jgi:putative toxin-antitoxin system antitoxin component (TIGR02293 family)
MAALLDVSTRTWQRQAEDTHLPTHAAELVLRLEGLWAQATEVLETQQNVQHWLRSPVDALEGAVPLSLLNTVAGVEACTQVLGRMAYGVY